MLQTVQSNNQTEKQYQAKDVPISEIVDSLSGNSGLTQQYLYSQIQTDSEKKYRILTGSIDYDISQYTHKCKHPKDSTKLIAVTEDKPVIHVIRKGKAGSTAYFEKGDYTINDDAYLLFLKENLPYKVNLKWLMYELRSRFWEYSSSSDNGTWNKTGFFQNVKIDIPLFDRQMQIVKIYEKLEGFKHEIDTIYLKINDIKNRALGP